MFFFNGLMLLWRLKKISCYIYLVLLYDLGGLVIRDR